MVERNTSLLIKGAFAGIPDEYHYRYNKRNHMNTIFDNHASRITKHEPTKRL